MEAKRSVSTISGSGITNVIWNSILNCSVMKLGNFTVGNESIKKASKESLRATVWDNVTRETHVEL